MVNDKPVYVHILTAGRTGSTYIDNLFRNNYSDVSVFAEREPSRLIKLLNNIGLMQLPIVSSKSDKFARLLYAKSRNKWMNNCRGVSCIIEINPFIVGMGSYLTDIESGPSIHIIRHPVAWVRSSIGFGSYSWRRSITPYFPLARERPPLSHPDWSKWTEIEKYSWRWVYRNKSIDNFSACRPKALHRVFKYEELFKDGAPNLSQFKSIAAHLGLNPENITEDKLIQSVINPTHERHSIQLTEEETKSILSICGDLARDYGYI